eukprot:scaffold111283_cov29-Tisochrysis_lutea.AAC.5
MGPPAEPADSLSLCHASVASLASLAARHDRKKNAPARATTGTPSWSERGSSALRTPRAEVAVLRGTGGGGTLAMPTEPVTIDCDLALSRGAGGDTSAACAVKWDSLCGGGGTSSGLPPAFSASTSWR